MTARWLVENLAAHWVQSGLITAAALVMLRAFRLREPRVVLAILQTVLSAILLLPLVQPWHSQARSIDVNSVSGVRFNAIVTLPVEGPDASSWTAVFPLVVIAILALGMAMRLLWLGYGFARTAGHVALNDTGRDRPRFADELEARLGVCSRYVTQPAGRGPGAFGVFRPTVALPKDFDALEPAHQRAILCHELLHLKRRDAAVALAEELAVATAWFHPWVWLLRSQIRIAREQVVDRSVVALTGNREEYVRCLMEVAGHDLDLHLAQAGAGLMHPRELRARIDALFEEVHMSSRRLVVMAIALIVVVGGAGWATALAVPLRAPGVSEIANRAQAAPATADGERRQTRMSATEYPADALEKGVRGTVIVAITVNPAGQVTTASVVSGPQELRASAFKAAMGLEFSPAATTTAMTIPIEYSLDVNSWGVRVGSPGAAAGAFSVVASAQIGAGPDASGAYRVGGPIRPPRKIADVPPIYPEEAQRAKVEGVVLIEARIDQSGNVSDARLLRSVPMLDQAAIEAVRKWRYEPTWLNGEPVPVYLTVTLNFTLRTSAPGTVVVLGVTVPPELQRTPGPVNLRVRENDLGVVVTSDNTAFGFVPLAPADGSSDRMRIAIYRMNPEGRSGPQALATVDLSSGGGVVQTPTAPTFGLELLTIDRR